MSFDIVENVPIPNKDWKPRKYNIDELDVGGALVIPQGEKHTSGAIYAGARALGIKVSVRKFAEDDEHGRYKAGDTGVWRVA